MLCRTTADPAERGSRREQLPLSTPPPAASPEASRLAALRDNLRMRLMLSARTSAIRQVNLIF